MKYLKNFLLFETVNTDEYLTVEENRCLKQIYLFLRDVLLDFKKQVLFYYQKNNGEFSVSNFIKNHYKVPDKVMKMDGNSISINFDKIDAQIRKIFKNLQEDFIIYFIPKDEGASIKHKTNPSRITGMEIGTTKLFNYPEEALKSSLQHEIQHIANITKEGIEEGDFDSGYIIYLTSKKEIDSHAKQFAYLYKKKYPKDKEIEIRKLQQMDIVERSKNKLNLYLWFMLPEQFRKLDQNKNITDKVYNQIVNAGESFKEKIKYYFKLFQK